MFAIAAAAASTSSVALDVVGSLVPKRPVMRALPTPDTESCVVPTGAMTRLLLEVKLLADVTSMAPELSDRKARSRGAAS